MVVFYNDKTSFNTMLELMAESREGVGESSPLRYTFSFDLSFFTGCRHMQNIQFLECCVENLSSTLQVSHLSGGAVSGLR